MSRQRLPLWFQSRLIQPRGLKWSSNAGISSSLGRGLYSLVDWNHPYICSIFSGWLVEAYTASWIEIILAPHTDDEIKVEAYTASWIEIIRRNDFPAFDGVEAYTASWIEIAYLRGQEWQLQSRLIQPRGLKWWWKNGSEQIRSVEAYTASWIEIPPDPPSYSSNSVEAYTASWIEMELPPVFFHPLWSRLIQPRGLKSCNISGTPG